MSDQMVDYIRNGLRDGYPAESLRRALIDRGYPVAEVSRAFSVVQGPAPGAIRPVYSEKPSGGPPASGKKVIVRRIGVFPAGKISAVMGAAMGLLIGIVIAVQSMLLGPMLSQLGGSGVEITGGSANMLDPQSMLLGFGALAIVVAPIVFAILGFLGGAVTALIYNILAGLVGGYEMELE
jgi:hypothetical protein